MARTKHVPVKNASNGTKMKPFSRASKTPAGHSKQPAKYPANPVSNEAVKVKDKSDRSSDPSTRKKRRFHPGTVALRQIRKQQKQTVPCITKIGFRRWLRSVCDDIVPGLRFFQATVDCVQASMEAYLIHIVALAQLDVCDNGKIKLTPDSIKRVYNIMKSCGAIVAR